MIVGIGVDIIATKRIACVVGRGGAYSSRFAKRILSKEELALFADSVAQENKTEQIRYLSTRWCLKEALYKAAYPHQRLRWDDVTIYKVGSKPAVDVSWTTGALQGAHVHVSLSHDQDLLVGFAIIEKSKEK